MSRTVISTILLGLTFFVGSLLIAAEENPTDEVNSPKDDILAKTIGDADYLLVEFYMTDCPACAYNWPLFIDLAEKSSELNVTSAAICLDRNEETALEYLQTNFPDLEMDVIFDSSRELAREFKIRFTPTTLLLKKGDLHNINGLWGHVGTFEGDVFDHISEIIALDQQESDDNQDGSDTDNDNDNSN